MNKIFSLTKGLVYRLIIRMIAKCFRFFGRLIYNPNHSEIPWSPSISLWASKNYSIPSTPEVKRNVLKRHSLPGAKWLETGTYLGETSYYLSKFSNSVTTIEPSEFLFKRAKEKYNYVKNIDFVFGTSEERFEEIIMSLQGDLNIFLDGHYSEGLTFKSNKDCPLLVELESLVRNLRNFNKIHLFIDDVRLMNPSLPDFRDYPTLLQVLTILAPFTEQVVVEHDILVVYLHKTQI